MFGIGFFEILIVVIGVLIFVRPKDLPQFIYKIGKIYKEIRLAYEAVMSEFNNLADQGRDLVERGNKEVKNTFSEPTVNHLSQREIKKPRLSKVLKDVDKEKINLKKTSRSGQKKKNDKNLKKEIKATKKKKEG